MESLESLDILEYLESLEFESFELESSLSNCIGVLKSFSSLDLRELLLLFGDPFVLLDDLLSTSDSELLSGENMLFFLYDPESDLFDFGTFELCLGVFEPGLPLESEEEVDVFDLAEALLLGGNGLAGFGASSSLDDDIFTLDGLLCFGSSFSLGSSGSVGDLGGGTVVVAGVSDVEESESELLDPDPEVEEELALLLESEVDSELLSVLLLLT